MEEWEKTKIKIKKKTKHNNELIAVYFMIRAL